MGFIIVICLWRILFYTERTKVLAAVQDALQLLIEKRPDDPLLFLSQQYPLHSFITLMILPDYNMSYQL